jgi:hypothetical protein
MDIFQRKSTMEGFLRERSSIVHFFWPSFLYFFLMVMIMKLPTWNYIAVHVYGKLKLSEGGAVIASLKKLVVISMRGNLKTPFEVSRKTQQSHWTTFVTVVCITLN